MQRAEGWVQVNPGSNMTTRHELVMIAQPSLPGRVDADGPFVDPYIAEQAAGGEA